MSVSLTNDEIEARAPVWAALSNLFVDTDVSLLRDHIATELAASPYSDAELLQILRQEAGPTFFANLLSVAGEWVGWDAAEASAKVCGYLNQPPALRWLQRILSKGVVERVIATEWPSIRALRILEREP